MKKWNTSDAFDYVKGSLSDTDKDAFEQAIAEDQNLAKTVAEAKEVLTIAQSAREASEALHGRKILNEVLSPESRDASRGTGVRWFVPSLGALSAAIVLLVVVSNQEPAYTPLWAFQPPPTNETASELVWLPLGEGSRVSPSATSLWSVDVQNDDLIELSLSTGRLDCDVSKGNPDRNFVVKTNDVRVEVRGTRFSVTAEESGQVGVSVTEGRVAVLYNDQEALLGAGESWDTTQKLPVNPKGQENVAPTNEELSAMGSDAPTRALPADAAKPLAGEAPEPTQNVAKRPTQPEVVAPSSPRPKAAKIVEQGKEQGAVPSTSKTKSNQDKSNTVEIVIPHQQQRLEEPAQVASAETTPPDRAGAKRPSKAARAVQLIREGNCEEALNLMGTLKPATLERKSDILYLRGYCHHISGNKTLAQELFKKMDTQEPGNPWLPTVGQWLNPPKPTAIRLR